LSESTRAGLAGRITAALIVVAVLLPMLPLGIWPFAQRWLFPALLPTEWGWRGWSYVLSPGSRVIEALIDSAVIATLVTLIALVLGLPAGRAFASRRFRGRTLVHFVILAPTIVPTIAVAMGIHVVFIRLGLVDTLAGVIAVHLVPVLPYVVLILAGIFANHSAEFEEQARTLGANRWQVLAIITLPGVAPGVMVAGLFAFLISWSQYLLTLLIGGGQVVTLPLLLISFVNSGDNAVAAAISLVMIAPAMLVLLLTSHALGGADTTPGGFGKL